jgi:peptidoglycan hydrolase-like protein with peptidoglycan-binding domain
VRDNDPQAPAKKPKPTPKPAAKPPAAAAQATYSSNGLSRAQIVALQKKIGVNADGIFGPKTHDALVKWQGANGLVADGIPGPRTLAKAGLGSGSTGTAPKPGTGGSKAPAKLVEPKLSDAELAQNYGWSMAILNSDPSLKKLFQDAVKYTYTVPQFQAHLQATPWFQKHGEAWRLSETARLADPATYAQRVASTTAKVVQAARGYGVTLTAAQAKQMAGDYIGFGWSDDQLQQHIAGYASYTSTSSPLSGSAGAAALQYKRIAQDYGLNLDDGQMSSLVRGTVAGTVDDKWVTQWAQQHAKSAYPALAKRIDAGETIASIADPYKQAYSKVLEVNPNSINLDDRLIKQALQGKDDKGQPAVQSLWQFEDTLRNDSRWSQTQNARDGAAATAHGVLQSFGLVS